MSLLLVDSSAWISFFSRRPSQEITTAIVEAKKAALLATCDLIHLEVVRGARTDKEYRELVEEFHAMKRVAITGRHWEEATKMGFALGRKGLNPPATDLLISAVALVEKCALLHCDKHFGQIAGYYPLRMVTA